MSKITLLDTGSFVGMLYRRDQFHAWATAEAAKLAAPLSTCEAVLSETCFLLQKFLGTSEPAYEFIETGAAQIIFNLDEEFEAVKELAARYQNVPMSLADACLVRMSEVYTNSTVFTTDSDFRIYRRHGNQEISLIIPPEM